MATNILHSHDGSVEGDRRTERERESEIEAGWPGFAQSVRK